MKQIIFIRGGEAFDEPGQYEEYLRKREYNPFKTRKSRADRVGRALEGDYQMIIPVMPCKQNAHYPEWKIWFEKIFPYLNAEELIVVGNSLGTTFLLKYLLEETFPKPISQLHLVCPYMTSEGVIGEGVGDFAFNTDDLSKIENIIPKIFIYASQDDTIVPFFQAERLAEKLPKATFMQFTNRGHFLQPALPELLYNIKDYSSDRVK